MEISQSDIFFDSSPNEESLNIDFKAIFETLKRKWKFILYCTLAAGVIGCLFAIGIPRQYKVVSKVAPELSLRSNSLTSLASLTGMGMSSMLSGNNDAILPSVYPDIIESTPFLVDLLESQVTDTTLYAYMKNDMPSFWLMNILALPSKAVGAVTSIFKDETEEELLNESGHIDYYHMSKEQFSMCSFLKKNIDVDINKKNFLVTITLTFPDKVIAAKLSRLIVDNLKDYVTEYRIQKAINNAEYLELVTQEAYEDYIQAQNEYALYLDRNQSIMLKSNLTKGLDYQNRVNLKFQLYSSLTSELQQARTKVSQETPVFAEILPPSIPVKSANSRKKVALVFAFLGFMGACAVVLLRNKREE